MAPSEKRKEKAKVHKGKGDNVKEKGNGKGKGNGKSGDERKGSSHSNSSSSSSLSSSVPTSSTSKGSFSSMGLDLDLIKGLTRMRYTAPTPVQRKALPIVLAGMDMVCMARTGSGKTCVFLLPLVQKLKCHNGSVGVRAVVLSPTRELAMQTFKFAKDMAKFTDLRIISIVGGDPIEAQFEALSSHPDVIIATPGRLMHHLREIPTFKLIHVRYLVFDEADRLFEMGFAEQLNEIVRECPEERQTLLFSATMPKMIIQFSRAGLRDPQLVRLDTDTKMSEELRLGFFSVRSNEKIAALLYFVRKIIPKDQLTIIFTATRHHSEFLHMLFQQIGVSSTVVYGTMDQDARSANLNMFRKGEVSYMIVTDVAARGIDVPLLNNVINFHFPPSPKLFVHRCGRAARQGRIGFALSFVEPEEMAYAMDVLTFLGKDLKTTYDPAVEGGVGSNPISDGKEELVGYTLEIMTPQLVHFGLLPQDCIDQENDFLKRALSDDSVLSSTLRVSENGYMQYRRTRTEATREGVKKAKLIAKNNSIKSIHPLIIGCDPSKCSQQVLEKASFVRMLQTFRPAQTVFETGIGTGTGSQTVKGLQKKGSKESKGVEMMKALRRVTASALERNKPNKKQTDEMDAGEDGGGAESHKENESLSLDNMGGGDSGEWDDFEIGDSDEFVGTDDRAGGSAKRKASDMVSEDAESEGTKKVRLSISERKKLKKQGLSAAEIREVSLRKAATDAIVANSTKAKINSLLEDELWGSKSSHEAFKDKRFYMDYGTENEHANYEEEALQPKAGLRSAEAASATMLESAYLDVDPDEALDLNRKKRMMRWDAKKRKFVKQSLEEMASSKKGAKRIRTESGIMIKGSSLPQGEMYEKWKKKTKREVSMAGLGSDDDDRPRPSFKHNTKVPDEIRSAHEVRKLKANKTNLKMKNMEKSKRTKLEAKNRAARRDGKKVDSSLSNKTKAGLKKVKAILRY